MVVLRPLSATLLRSDGTPTALPKNRPTSALLRQSGSDAKKVPPSAQKSNHYHVDSMASPSLKPKGAAGPAAGTNNNKAQRPESAKPTRSSAINAAMEESKSLIRQIFELCEQLKMDSEFTEALHRHFQRCSLTDVDAFEQICNALSEHRRTTISALRKIEARERVLHCLEEFVETHFGSCLLTAVPASSSELAMHMSGGPGSSTSSNLCRSTPTTHSLHVGRDSNAAQHHRWEVQDYGSPIANALSMVLHSSTEIVDDCVLSLKERLPSISAEGDAIMQSLMQCTDAVRECMTDWDHTSERLWCRTLSESEEQGRPPVGAAAAPLSATGSSLSSHARMIATLDLTMAELPVGVRAAVTPPTQARVFPFRGVDYKAKLTKDLEPFQQLQEHWSLSHIAKVIDMRERRAMRERLLANDEAQRRHQENLATKARDEFLNVAAAKIQALYRGHRAYMWFQMLLMKKLAVRKIRSWWRKMKIRRRFVRATDFGNAALLLQRHWRGYVARRSFPLLLQRNRAAIAIQRWWRYWDCQMRMVVRQLERAHQHNAALIVCRAVKRFSRRMRAKKAHEKVSAALLIQRWGRGRAMAAQVAQLISDKRYFSDTSSMKEYDATLMVVLPSNASNKKEWSCHSSDATVELLHNSTAAAVVGTSSRFCDASMMTENDDREESFSPPREAPSRSSSPVPVSTVSHAPPRPPPAPVLQRMSMEFPVLETELRGFDSCVRVTAAPLTTDGEEGEGAADTLGTSAGSAAASTSPSDANIIQAEPEGLSNGLECHDMPADVVVPQEYIDMVISFMFFWISCRWVKRVACRATLRQSSATRAIQRWWRGVAEGIHQSNSLTAEDKEFASLVTSNIGENHRMSVVPTSAKSASASLPRGREAIAPPGAAVAPVVKEASSSSSSSAKASTFAAVETLSDAKKKSLPSQRPLPTKLANSARPAQEPQQQQHVSPCRVTVGTVPIQVCSARDAETLRRRKQAAMKIAAWAKTIIARVIRTNRTRNYSASVIARAFRHFKLQRGYFLRRRAREIERLQQEEEQRALERLAEERRRRSAALCILYAYQRYKCNRLISQLDATAAMIRSRPDRDACAAAIQKFWKTSRDRLVALRLQEAQEKARQSIVQRERVIEAAVKIQSRFRGYMHRFEFEERRRQFVENRTLAAVVIQKYVRRWLSKNTFWQEKISRLSMFKELQVLRKKEAQRTATAALRRPPPKSAW